MSWSDNKGTAIYRRRRLVRRVQLYTTVTVVDRIRWYTDRPATR